MIEPPSLRWALHPSAGRPSGAFSELVERITRVSGSPPLDDRPGEHPLDFFLAPSALRPVGSQPVVWVETAPPARGVVCLAASGRPLRRFPFDCLGSTRLRSRRGPLLDAAARTILACAARDENAPWPPLADSPASPRRTLSRLLQAREWGIALRDGRTWSSVLRQPGMVVADPFPLVHGGRTWILFEEQRRGKPGRLSAGVLEGSSLTEIVHDIMPAATHRSWPNTFHHGGEIWMIPESGADGEVALWRCERFPDRWEKARILLRGRNWTDPVLLFRDGLWWLFVSPCGPEDGSHSDRLEIFHSRDLLEESFQPHPWNPVSIGIAGSRPAGRIFLRDGVLLRPAQDCSGHYGRALVFQEIVELSPTRYAEKVAGRIDAPSGTSGIHTWNALDDGRILIDLLWDRPRWSPRFPAPEEGVWPVA